jgi:alkylation response protein AidB-like acyl-CoA dehydrogenase
VTTTSLPEAAPAILAAAAQLGPQIAGRVEEIEHTRKVPAELIQMISDAGIFRMLIPREFGGYEVELDDAIQVIAEIARHDASAGWQVLVGAGNQYFLGWLPEHSMRTAMAASADVLVRGALAPNGVGRRVEGGFLISGRWPLASGSYQADWVLAGFLIMGEAGPLRLPNGAPDIRVAVIRPDDVTWHDTWDSVGLRGSQSQDFEVHDVFVPDDWAGPFAGPSSIDSPWFSLPPMPTGPLHAAVSVGALQGMVDDLGALAATKKPAFGGGQTLADDPVFTTSFGELGTQVDMLEAVTLTVATTLMEIARSGDVDPVRYQRMLTMNAHVQRHATTVADQLMALAGSSSIYTANSMQRRWRDIRCVAQHLNAGTRNYTALGTFLAGGTPHGH